MNWVTTLNFRRMFMETVPQSDSKNIRKLVMGPLTTPISACFWNSSPYPIKTLLKLSSYSFSQNVLVTLCHKNWLGTCPLRSDDLWNNFSVRILLRVCPTWILYSCWIYFLNNEVSFLGKHQFEWQSKFVNDCKTFKMLQLFDPLNFFPLFFIISPIFDILSSSKISNSFSF
jgi:hypothetical protein